MAAQELREAVAGWARLWGVPGLEDMVTLTFSPRLRRSLGRCRPATGRITLQSALRDAPPAALLEVLCHEAAHVAAHRIAGPEAKPHGPEWRRLVEAAGYEASVRRMEATASPARAGDGTPPGRLVYEHRCPVCQTARFARRPVPAWRCAECLDAGLSGEMIVTRHAPESDA